VRTFFIVTLILLGAAAEARPLRDRAADRDTRCDPDLLPPGAGIDGCPRLLDTDRWPQAEFRYDAPSPSPSEPKPLWVPPLAPSPKR